MSVLKGVTFLDTFTYVEIGSIETTVYTKPKNKEQCLYRLLELHSYVSVPRYRTVRLLGYRRIVEDNDMLNAELNIIKQRFINRG
jgi:hypothetical protein